jgi:hypothetical protein
LEVIPNTWPAESLAIDVRCSAKLPVAVWHNRSGRIGRKGSPLPGSRSKVATGRARNQRGQVQVEAWDCMGTREVREWEEEEERRRVGLPVNHMLPSDQSQDPGGASYQPRTKTH